MDFSNTVKHVRKKLNLSQKQLAECINVSFATINRWENKRVDPSNLAKKTFYEFCENSFIDLSEFYDDF
jgi:putative transcriptional regulator